MVITQAVIPAAGFGTRLRPLSEAIPKEMLPIGRMPVLEHIVLEMKSAGIEHVIMVVSPGKEIIQKYFGGNRHGICIDYVIQREMKGLGDALLLSSHLLNGPFLVGFGDCIIESAEHAATKRLVVDFQTHPTSATVLVQSIPRGLSDRYGIVVPKFGSDLNAPFPFVGIVEKPEPKYAPSELAVSARYILTLEAIDTLRVTAPAKNGELQLTDAIQSLAENHRPLRAVPLVGDERRWDIGAWESYLRATIHFALQDQMFKRESGFDWREKSRLP